MINVNENKRTTKVAPDPNLGKGPENSILKTFLIGEMKDIYWAENHLVKTLPKMAEAATSSSLKQLFTTHLGETKIHVRRLEKAFEFLGIPAEAVKCEAMEGIVKEGEGIIADTKEGTSTRDAGLILAAQKAEHYEISTYGGLSQIAHILGLHDVAGLMEATMDEEKGADKLLSLAASSGIILAASTENKE